MYIDKFKKDDGYYSQDGCFYGTAEDFIQGEILGFCGCGVPEENLRFIMRGLSHIDKERPDNDPGWYDEWVKEGIEIFGNDAVRFFFFYWADKEKLTAHGGSVPGWLADKGRELLSDLVEMHKEIDKPIARKEKL